MSEKKLKMENQKTENSSKISEKTERKNLREATKEERRQEEDRIKHLDKVIFSEPLSIFQPKLIQKRIKTVKHPYLSESSVGVSRDDTGTKLVSVLNPKINNLECIKKIGDEIRTFKISSYQIVDIVYCIALSKFIILLKSRQETPEFHLISLSQDHSELVYERSIPEVEESVQIKTLRGKTSKKNYEKFFLIIDDTHIKQIQWSKTGNSISMKEAVPATKSDDKKVVRDISTNDKLDDFVFLFGVEDDLLEGKKNGFF